MLTQYLGAALRQAHYEFLSEERQFYGEIASCNGVYATGKSLEECRDELADVLEAWILFRLHRNVPLPVIDGLELSVKEVPASARQCGSP